MSYVIPSPEQIAINEAEARAAFPIGTRVVGQDGHAGNIAWHPMPDSIGQIFILVRWDRPLPWARDHYTAYARLSDLRME
jgi:hypothetical protein